MNAITVFTPTFNRAHTLPRLYESLKNQTLNIFEWLIVDDGSTDNTNQVVQTFIKEAPFKINYLKQKNQGKHIAINTGLKQANGDFFLVIDSDDYLRPNADKILRSLILEVNAKENFAGFTGIHYADSIVFNPDDYGTKRFYARNEYIWKEKGEMGFCYKTEIAKRYPFPNFIDEKFCPESLVHQRIAKDYKVLYTDHVLFGGHYQAGGLSSQFQDLVQKNPRAFLLSYSEKLKFANNRKAKEYYAKFYWHLAMKTKKVSLIEKLRGIPIYFTINFWFRRVLRKN